MEEDTPIVGFRVSKPAREQERFQDARIWAPSNFQGCLAAVESLKRRQCQCGKIWETDMQSTDFLEGHVSKGKQMGRGGREARSPRNDCRPGERGKSLRGGHQDRSGH